MITICSQDKNDAIINELHINRDKLLVSIQRGENTLCKIIKDRLKKKIIQIKSKNDK